MRKVFFVAGFILISCYFLVAQECTFYYPATEGAKLEYTSYDAKDKVTGSSVQVIQNVVENAGTLKATINVEVFDKKEKELGAKSFDVKCTEGIYSVDMKSFLDPSTMAAYEEMDVKINSTNLVIPSNPGIGDVLPDGKLEIDVYSEGVKMMGISTEITQRKVEGKEQVTTEAGTFDCIKITYTITTKTMFSVRVEAAEWIAENVGTVKSETYSRGKVIGYTLLTGIKK
ncbi:MAG: hypothetical protein V2I54_08545 [Bacteroidales bacterium]|jgi:hypothetical protein|nr:hypothetical protein [Bacteroidales bacterium]